MTLVTFPPASPAGQSSHSSCEISCHLMDGLAQHVEHAWSTEDEFNDPFDPPPRG